MMSNKNKLTFFENIYYWISYFLPKKSERWHHSPEGLGCTFLSILKGLNFLWLVMFLGAIFKKNILASIFGEFDGKVAVVLTFIPLILLLGWYDERKYERRADLIVKKMDQLNKKEKLKKKYIFFIYTIVSLLIWYTANDLLSMYD